MRIARDVCISKIHLWRRIGCEFACRGELLMGRKIEKSLNKFKMSK